MWPKQFFWMLFPKPGRNWVTFGTCLCERALLCLPIRPWGSRWWGRWSQITVRRCWRRIHCRARRCSPPLSPEATLSVSSLQEEKTASESSSDCFYGGGGIWLQLHICSCVLKRSADPEQLDLLRLSFQGRIPLQSWFLVTDLFLFGRTAEWPASLPFRTRKPTGATRCMCPLYDNNRKDWIELEPLSVPRINHGVVAAGQCVLAPKLEKPPPEQRWC